MRRAFSATAFRTWSVDVTTRNSAFASAVSTGRLSQNTWVKSSELTVVPTGVLRSSVIPTKGRTSRDACDVRFKGQEWDTLEAILIPHSTGDLCPSTEPLSGARGAHRMHQQFDSSGRQNPPPERSHNDISASRFVIRVSRPKRKTATSQTAQDRVPPCCPAAARTWHRLTLRNRTIRPSQNNVGLIGLESAALVNARLVVPNCSAAGGTVF